jgi:hypothetical protein
MEGHGEDQNEADGVGPDVDELVRDVESRLDTLELGFREAVSPLDIRVVSPWDGQFLVHQQASL